ncbi:MULTISPECIES: hypothetical protein [Haloarcula]|uniref:Uncharacterized protein n=1 Tax=Haloarcula pellucida TaxID=1427151 RepID=A0A830GG18_9EURY|nr:MULTISPECIES: hypothetical protein [Halomicroarcula]MBX0346816.1 hypothetical protein [Halomicroarcula pellucida]MDS0277310.1 hypothetical protein [Halomicroarcula sp. S1AR25-4]GGN85629.1 hypothetical protein GCM10009030_02360 [Halomicroarcula pellucida]
MDDARLLRAFVLPELAMLSILLLYLGARLTSETGRAASLSRPLTLAAFLFVLLELLIPLAVCLDVCRRPDDPDMIRVHAAAMPLVNVLGVLAYLDDRKRSREK